LSIQALDSSICRFTHSFACGYSGPGKRALRNITLRILGKVDWKVPGKEENADA
jgi:hypothetical protein